MADQPTRRGALAGIAGAAAASVSLPGAQPAAPAQQTFTPRSFTKDEFRLVSLLVELIIPESDTPGAAAAGVDRIIDEELTKHHTRLGQFKTGLKVMADAGFAELNEARRVELLTKFSESEGDRGRFFRLLKNLTIDAYYSTEAGLVQELGYQGNGYLREFPGCDHEDHG